MARVQGITFLVPGRELAGVDRQTRGAAGAPAPAHAGRGTLKHSVAVSSQRAAGGAAVVSAVPGEDVMVLQIESGPALVLHPENARDLMQSQSGGERGPAPAGGPVPVPVRLQWRGLEDEVATRGASRGFLGHVIVKSVEVLTGLAADKAADFAASAVVRKVDAQVNPGVYALKPDALGPLKGQSPVAAIAPGAADGPAALCLIHGTFSTTSGSFGRLWTHHPDRVRTLFARYANRVYALDHPTLGVSPIANALTLARALPPGSRLHLVTHSRGGLVGEVLARVCANPKDPFKAFTGRGYAGQREELKELAALVARNRIAVERVVRVACPARGTLLASRRLDAYLSVLKWSLELAGIPVAPEMVDFLGEVARRRADPASLPGLAAQMPDSPLVQWIHATPAPIPGDLRVVAGDMDGDSVTTWVKTLLADAFYWTDNDLVVQTRSMYGGSPRGDGAAFLLDQGGRVTHFNYFSNDHTAAAVVNALVQDRPQGFATIGPLSWAGESAAGTRAAVRSGRPAAAPDAERPIVFLVPGILGSHLKAGGRRVWLDQDLAGGLEALHYSARRGAVRPDGLLDLYDSLAEFLGASHEVVKFAYDWRRPLEEAALDLGRAVAEALAVRARSRTAVRIVAHSTGGLVVRAMQLESADVWKRLLKSAGARVLMLGTPNRGCWTPMQVLSGDDTLGNTLTSAGRPFTSARTRHLFASFPGFMQVQAGLLDGDLPLGSRAAWEALAARDIGRLQESSPWHQDARQLDAYEWGIPSSHALERAVTLRRRLDTQPRADLTGAGGTVVMVTGHSTLTPAGFDPAADDPSKRMVYLNIQDGGDGRVPEASALLDGVPAWSADCDHVALATRPDVFPAYADLLASGDTRRLMRRPDGMAAGVTHPATQTLVGTRPSRSRVSSQPPQRTREAFGSPALPPRAGAPARGTALRITVTNGDLTFIPEPLMLGHYRASKLTGTERVMNTLIGGAMEAALKRGVYPVAPGTHQIFVNTRTRPDNPWQLPRPRSVIVVGLGEEGNLRSAEVVHTVRQAVIAWAQRLAEGADVPELFSLATTLIASGGTGITAGESAQLIAQGVREANQQLEDDFGGTRAGGAAVAGGLPQWPRVDHLHIIELYLDRASDAWRALQIQAAASPAAYVVSGPVRKGTGALRRPLDSGYRGADYDFITALSGEGRNAGNQVIVYTLDTKRARSEVRALTTQGPLIRNLVSTASNNTNADAQIGRTLFQLLVPLEMEAFLGGRNETQIEVDGGTAGIPWELLDTDTAASSDPRPWAVRTKLLRKLRTTTFRDHVVDALAEDGVLVIGDPRCDRKIYPPLPAARNEALAVVRCFSRTSPSSGRHIRAVISDGDPSRPEPDARTVINAVMERSWRIVHIAAHGEPPDKIGPVPQKAEDPPQQAGNPRGVVLSDDAFLGPREIQCMRVVPELVFVNCCHLAARDINRLLTPEAPGRGGDYDRARFAAGVAESLIAIGVRCVIAAGWAVDDLPANAFASRFYEALLGGCRFIDAVAEAREEARALGGNTWAAYQCYGDPDWRYRTDTADAQRPAPPSDEFAGVASPTGLILALDTLAVRIEFQHAPPDDQKQKIRYLETAFAGQWGGIGQVAEAFGNAWAKAGEADSAVTWYERARSAPDGTASVACLEQLANLYVRRAWKRVEAAAAARDRRAAAAGARPRRGRPAAARKGKRPAPDWSADFRKAITEAMRGMDAARELLDRLLTIGTSVERLSLYGSLYKRLAMMHAVAGRPREEGQALEQMRERYAEAQALAAANKSAALFYPAMNRLAADLALPRSAGAGVDLAPVRDAIAETVQTDPTFWSVVGQTELMIYQALAEPGGGALAAALEDITREFEQHHQRVSAPWMWGSVHDNATFVLTRYAARAPEREKQAAAALLETLRRFAALGT